MGPATERNATHIALHLHSVCRTFWEPNEFGKMVKLQEADNQIVIDFKVDDKRSNDSDLVIPVLEFYQAVLGRVPHLVAADAAFYSG